MNSYYSSIIFSLLILGFCSCSSNKNPAANPARYVFLGNELGLRPLTFDRGMVITDEGDYFRVQQPGQPNYDYSYPVRDGVLSIGVPGEDSLRLNLRRRKDTLGTVMITELEGENVYQLAALPYQDTIAGLRDFLASGAFSDREEDWRSGPNFKRFGREPITYLFEGATAGSGCLINNGYFRERDWSQVIERAKKGGITQEMIPPPTGVRRRQLRKDAVWSLDTRFGRQILVTASAAN